MIEREGKIEEKTMLKAARDEDSFILHLLGFWQISPKAAANPNTEGGQGSQAHLTIEGNSQVRTLPQNVFVMSLLVNRLEKSAGIVGEPNDSHPFRPCTYLNTRHGGRAWR